jgi:hypothetical protein
LRWIADGIAKAIEGRRGCESCREYRVVNFDVFDAVEVDRRGRNDERIDLVVTWAAAILMNFVFSP